MGANGFRDDELVSRRIKVGNDWQTKVFPVVGGRLRLAHEENQNLSIQTEMVNWDGQYAVFKCCAVTGKGQFLGYGTANSQRDARLAESLIELAETRSIARALRFAGYGMEYTGAEEVSHVAATEPERGQTVTKEPAPAFQGERGNNKPETKGDNGSNGKATQAQCRALYALTKRAKYTEEDVDSLLRPMSVSNFQDLTRESASQLISYLQTEVGQ